MKRLLETRGERFRATVSGATGTPTLTFNVKNLAGFGDDYFNDEWWVQVTKAGGVSPEEEWRIISDYVSNTGLFTVTPAFGAAVDVDDELLFIHEFQYAIGARDDAADYTYNSTTSSVIQFLKGILGSRVIGEGTFTTSSATVPADTSHSAKANDYFNGQILIPLTGSAAFQPRLIVDFTTTTGVFTIDPDHPFTAATGEVAYIIVANEADLIPGTDGTNDLTTAQVVGAKADTADYTYNATTSSAIRLLKGILGSRVIAEGTFTTDSATVPADTSRTEVTDYFNGQILMPVTGACAFQPRLIVNFSSVGDVFTLDAEHPFTGVPGLSAYVIIANEADLIPSTDATTDTTTAHAVGAKTDTADYSYNATTSSLMRLLKGVLGSRVIAEGTFTTDSATVPADTGRTEGNDYFNGQILIPLTGSAAFQPRLIADFTVTTGVFTLDPEHPFTAAPGLVTYIVVANEADLIPATDGTNDLTTAHVVGAKADTADYTYNATTSSLVRLVKGLLGAQIVGEGTFTTSSATVPADTGQGAKANDWFNGCLLIPLTGSVAFQPRRILDFTTTTGVFTVDPSNPFTAATGLVAYIVITEQTEFVPSADATINRTPADVIGNKSDTIPAMTAAPGATDSIVRHIKAILERVGITPADPDDSLLTSLGQRDATATADDLSDIATTDAQAKLRRLLLRFSSNAFSAAVNPGAAAATDVETMVQDMANMLAGATGIVTYPAAADIGNGVSLAESIRAILTSMVGGDDYDAYTNISNTANASLNAVAQKFATTIGIDGTNTFAPAMFGATPGTIEAAFAALGTALGAEFDGTPDIYDLLYTGINSSTITNNFDGGIMEVVKAGLEKTTAGAYAPDTDSNEALRERLDVITGATGIFHEQADTAFSIAVDNVGVDILDLNVASTRYIIRDMRMKLAADPGINTVTISLETLINDTPTVVDTFVIDTANWGTYFSLMDAFGVPHIAGDDIHIYATYSVAGPITLSGQYSMAKTNV